MRGVGAAAVSSAARIVLGAQDSSVHAWINNLVLTPYLEILALAIGIDLPIPSLKWSVTTSICQAEIMG